MKNEIEKYVNENIHLIKRIEFYSSFALVTMFDNTTIEIFGTDRGDIEVEITKNNSNSS